MANFIFAKMLLVACIVAVCLGADTANPGAAAVLERMFSTRHDAADFNQYRVKRAPKSKEPLREECCERICHFEERAEYEDGAWVNKNLYELSVVEGKACKCKSFTGYDYDCGSGIC